MGSRSLRETSRGDRSIRFRDKGSLMASTIFEKQASLKPSAMRTVAERRFDDAEALRKTKDNVRANGVAYLVGFVIEILLKAKLVEKFSRIAKTPQHLVKDDEREVWSLIWRRHDLDAMLLKMTELQANLKKKRRTRWLRLCWSTQGDLHDMDHSGQILIEVNRHG